MEGASGILFAVLTFLKSQTSYKYENPVMWEAPPPIPLRALTHTPQIHTPQSYPNREIMGGPVTGYEPTPPTPSVRFKNQYWLS